jgi:hypothetical protein
MRDDLSLTGWFVSWVKNRLIAEINTSTTRSNCNIPMRAFVEDVRQGRLVDVEIHQQPFMLRVRPLEQEAFYVSHIIRRQLVDATLFEIRPEFHRQFGQIVVAFPDGVGRSAHAERSPRLA